MPPTNKAHPLIIDPTLVYSTYLGGSIGDRGIGIATDTSGNVYITGYTQSTNFPIASPIYGIHGGGLYDAFVTKINASGNAIIYSTFIGGNGIEEGRGIVVDTYGNAYIAGVTSSTDFPTTSPIYGIYGGGPYDAFVTKIDASGTSIVYSTYLGGSMADEGHDIAIDTSGNAYITGDTYSNDFPTASPIYVDNTIGADFNAFVTKIDASGTSLVYSTYLGGSNEDWGFGIAVDTYGNAYITGQTTSTDFPISSPIYGIHGGGLYDAFVTKINASGNALVYSTYLGGSGSDHGYGIVTDTSENAYIIGRTSSIDFPIASPLQGTNAGGWDIFVTKIDTSGNGIVYSTYIGGSSDDWDGDGAIDVDVNGNAYITDYTGSANFPIVSPLSGTYAGGLYDAFITKINASGNALVYSTYLGGSGTEGGLDIAVHTSGNAYITGWTNSADFMVASPLQGTIAGDDDVFIAKFSFPPAELPRTGQTICYDSAGAVIPCAGTGQDGEVQAGMPWPDPRFTDNGDGTVTDNLTGLMWTKDANLGSIGFTSWWVALDYVARMNAGVNPNFGYTDWRLPNINELKSLIGAERSPALPASNPFTNVVCNGHRSSTSLGTNICWNADVFSGAVSYGSKSNNGGCIWAVRSGNFKGSIQIARTGQTFSYYPGDDGELKMGVSWPNPRFRDNNDGTVIDNLTGLMWTKDANLLSRTLSWQEALNYVADMNSGIYPNFGYTNWRLPNREEILSLIDFSRFNPALQYGHPFINVQYTSGQLGQNVAYWTSTTYAGLSNYAWIDFIGNGTLGIYGIDKSNNSQVYLWPVQSVKVLPCVKNIYYQDTDGDGYGNSSVTTQTCTQPAGYVSNSTDCNDGNASINPGAIEVCNGVDDNCNGQTDEGVQNIYYRDADSDTYGNVSVTTQACTQPSGYVSNSSDCNDGNASVYPGATEVCNGIDDNCNGQTDEGVQNTYYRDADNDTYGNILVYTQACTQPAGYVPDSTDCNDGDAAVNPGAAEVCNLVDDNCNGQSDEGVQNIYYQDADNDTYGSSSVTTQACTQPAGYVTNSTDCNDSSASINPGAAEVCNGVDDNCNGQTDEGVENIYYQDADSDTYGNVSVTTQACTQPSGYVSNSTDCNDGNASVNPGVLEVCNGVDDNCNGQIDEGVLNTYYRDADSDTYGNVSISTQACTAPSGYVTNSADCNDGNASINPGATEICSNSTDDNCNGQTDEGCLGVEVCDGIDNDLDGQVDEDFPAGNTSCGADVQVTPDSVTLIFSTVTLSGSTTVTTTGTGTPPPSGFKIGSPPTYYEINTTVTFTGIVEICINYNENQFTTERNLKLFHWTGSGWDNITTSMDTTANIICGNTTSFSPFIVAESSASPTAITMQNFSANLDGGYVILTWSTGSEMDNEGFIILRGESDGGPFSPITSAMIPTVGGGAMKATYTFTDSNVEHGKTYYYRLQDVDSRGVVTTHNVIPVTTGAGGEKPSQKGMGKEQETSVSSHQIEKSGDGNLIALSPEGRGSDVRRDAEKEIASGTASPRNDSSDHPHSFDFASFDFAQDRPASPVKGEEYDESSAATTGVVALQNQGPSSLSVTIEDGKGNVIEIRRVEGDKASGTPSADVLVLEEAGRVILTWQGIGQSKGFVIHRSEKGKNDYTPLSGLIPYFGRDGKEIFRYRFKDNSVKFGIRYDYRLETVRSLQQRDRPDGLSLHSVLED
ncbi:MAG: SBBP repeat-containing protein [Nitrospirae bacterium]|nr:SBBP repeat-containing protein [Nitrospirota bacterium]